MKPLNMSSEDGFSCSLMRFTGYVMFICKLAILSSGSFLSPALFIAPRTMVNRCDISGLNKLCVHFPGEHSLKLLLTLSKYFVYILYRCFLILIRILSNKPRKVCFFLSKSLKNCHNCSEISKNFNILSYFQVRS